MSSQIQIRKQKNLNVVVFCATNIGIGLSAAYLWETNYREAAFGIAAVFLTLGHVRDSLCAIVQTIRNASMVRNSVERALQKNVRPNYTRTIAGFITCYNEEVDSIMGAVDTVTTQKNVDDCTTFAVVVTDGTDQSCQGHALHTALLGKFTQLEEVNFAYCTWTGEQNHVTVTLCDYLGTLVFLVGKEHNTGKKCSLILGEELLANIFGNTSTFPNVGDGVIDTLRQQLRKYRVNTLDYIYHTDGDTLVDETAIGRMLHRLEDTGADACCGFVKINFANSNRFCNVWNNMQYAQYFGDQVLKRGMEGVMGGVSCLPGCNTMLKFGPADTLAVLDVYRRLPTGKRLFQTASRMVGTDRCYTKAILKRGGRVVMEKNAVVYTTAPQNIGQYVTQRKRWASNALSNSYCIMVSSKVTYFNKVNAFVDFIRIYFTPFRLASMVGFLYGIEDLTLVQLYLICGLIFPSLLFVCVHWVFWEKEYRANLAIGYIFSKIFTPVLSTLIALKLMFALDDFRWDGSASTHTTSTVVVIDKELDIDV
jgi:cellulose synthase/poly-beta-1,6-N-acetylglucosamine synthase-like glycosyltransferase